MKKQLFSKMGKYVLSAIMFVFMIGQVVGFSANVKADDSVGLEINGYQINTSMEAFRTLYSVSDPSDKVEEVGLVYGLTKYVSESDMVVGSTNDTVYSHSATAEGKNNICYSEMKNAQTYVMTMEFVKNVDFFKNQISVRPYAKLKDGTYAYGEIVSKSVYQIADVLYQNQLMGNAAKHDYLYNNILSFVDSSYVKKDFKGSSTIVKPGTAEETTVKATEAPTAKPATGDYKTDKSIAMPFGLVAGSPSNGTINIVWGRGDIDLYNVYINGVLVSKEVPCASYDYQGYAQGTYTVAVATVVGSSESERVTATVTVGSSSEPVTAAPTLAPTQAPTAAPTQAPTQQETSSTDFTTDDSIAMPFGMVVSSPYDGAVNVVWGQGTINCYNIYVDGERRRTGVKAQSITMPVYFEGTHTVAIATVVGTRESKRLEMTIAVKGIGEKETEPETCPPELKPQLRSDLSLRDDKILMQLNNKTNGKYSNSQIYWCLLGYNDAHQLCYMDKNGNLIPANLGMNNVKVGDRMVADVCYTLEEADHVYVPSIKSGRMYLSYEKPIYINFNQAADGTIGFAGPDLNNASDPNANTLFEFAEFTIDGKNYWGNTTRVDYFSFPMITRLIGHTQYETYDKVVGDIGTRDEIFAKFLQNAPDAYKYCVNDKRIMAPCKAALNSGQAYANYFDGYINEFWAKYTNEDLVFSSEAGSFRGRVVGNQIQFRRDGDSTVYVVDKPSTQDVLEGKGAFAKGNSVELAIEAQLCAAFNRGVATEPSKWYKPNEYYKNSINNYYAGFFHKNSVVGLAYGFCYDDVNDQSTLLQYDSADALVIDLKW